ncbi:MAG: oxygenase MpaB family protein [Acidimicrobiales bacterium]|nr:oxygenase MpaB family protein [Acidimicrobiales bacterium]
MSPGWRERVTESATGLFRHAPNPLADTFDHLGDPGLFGPGSVTWWLMSDAAAFVGGIRSLLVQAAHPEVAAGVGDHSAYREDPLGRLSRTAAYVTATTYGSLPEVNAALTVVRTVHRPVSGISHRGLAYDAGEPGMGAWVHNALVDSFLSARRTYGPTPVSDADADAYVAEQARLGERLGVSPLPDTAAELSAWLAEHPAAAPSPAAADAIAFLLAPRLPLPTRFAYHRLLHAAVATIPPRLQRAIGVRPHRGAQPAGRAVIGVLRAAMGSSPAWAAALERCGEPRPPGVRFRNPPGTTR